MRASSSSALVNVAEDAELRLVRLLADSSKTISPDFVRECEQCIVQGDASRLLRSILAEKGSVAALLSFDEEAASAISLLAALLDRVKSSQSAVLVEELSNRIVNATPGEANKTISLLATLYNMRAAPLEKVSILVKMIRVASSRQPSLLEPYGSVLGKWVDPTLLRSMLDDWKLEQPARRELYRAAAEGVSNPLAKQRFTLLLVETYGETDIDQAGLESSKHAAVGAIKDPLSLFVHQRNMLSLPAIQALERVEAPLLGLLKVFQEGKLEDYQSFVSSGDGKSVLARWEISPDDCTRHMRILSLCSLASEHEEIPYEVVAQTLQTTPAEVEKWVIAGVSSGLLSAKMDQLKEKVIVESSVVRKFDIEQWKAMQARLQQWKRNVSSVLDAYRQRMQQ